LKYAMLIDTTRCCLCTTCVVACKDEFVGNPYPPYSYPQPDSGQQWIKLLEIEKGKYPYPKIYPIPLLCMHCDKAPCIDACPIPNCIYKAESGVIIIDPLKCNPSVCKRKPCMDACPYRVIYFNEARNVCQKCTFCMHRLEQGKEPACVAACPVGVFHFGKASKLSDEIKKRGGQWMHPEHGTEPRVFYIGLPSISLAGHIIDGQSLMDVPDANIIVTDSKTGLSVSCNSNIAGNFLADNLTMDVTYTVKIKHHGYLTKDLNNVYMDIEYKHLGDVKLVKT
jgi:tetrathionate reductase subunit B